MKEYSQDLLEKETFLLYVYTPLCATCNFARSMLKRIEMTHQKDIFYQINAAFYSDLMQEMKIESVPCLIIQTDHQIQEKIYTFHSIPNIYYHLSKYVPDIFTESQKQ